MPRGRSTLDAFRESARRVRAATGVLVFGKRSDQQRTADDRARAAAERAARRAGRPLPPEAFKDTVQPPDVEPHDPGWHEEAPRRRRADAAGGAARSRQPRRRPRTTTPRDAVERRR